MRQVEKYFLLNYSFHCIRRPSAEQALQLLQGTLIGGQNVRLSWGRSPSNKQTQVISCIPESPIRLSCIRKLKCATLCFQPQQDANQWGAAAGGQYGGYGQGYEAYGGYAQPQNPNMYGYGGYAGYPNYQQPAAAQQPPPQQVKFLIDINANRTQMCIPIWIVGSMFLDMSHMASTD